MKNKRHTKIASVLFGIWCVLYGLFAVGSRIYVSYQQVINGIDTSESMSIFQLGIVTIIFIPSLFGIYHLTKQCDSMKLKKITQRLLLILCIWAVAMTVYAILSAVVPGFLS